MFLTETWSGTDGPVSLNETKPPNYGYLYLSHTDKCGGGTATIFSSYNFKHMYFSDYSSFEYHSLTLVTPSILFICIYWPPRHFSEFITDFSDLLSKDFVHSKHKIIIVGDFNMHVNNQSDSLAREFLYLLNYMNFKQHVLKPTHNKGHILDLAITYGLSEA